MSDRLQDWMKACAASRHSNTLLSKGRLLSLFPHPQSARFMPIKTHKRTEKWECVELLQHGLVRLLFMYIGFSGSFHTKLANSTSTTASYTHQRRPQPHLA